ncbi:MAG: flagellar biosynthesis protein FlgE [Gammaproteobacteria bacterium]|nr:MAG: flagellar biosynthesis protein FlgE [Gammaproteobacteria bacterium]
MAISSVIQTGVQGVQQAITGIDRSAAKIAGAGSASTRVEDAGGSDSVKPLVDMKIDEISAKANAEVVDTGNNMLGTLLDIQA